MSLIITDAGIAASTAAGELNVKYNITHISIGTSGYKPYSAQTELLSEVARVAVTEAVFLDDGMMSFTAIFGGGDSFDVKEIGYWLEDGTLLAVDSREGVVISVKNADTVLTEVFHIRLTGEAIENISINVTPMLEILNLLFPVGHYITTLNPANPSTYQHPGVWELQPDDIVLSSTTDESKLGVTEGTNEPSVPVPAHTHSTTFKGAPIDPHGHTVTSGNGSFGDRVSSGAPDSGGRAVATTKISAGTPTGDILMGNAGVANATLDVRGKRTNAFIWLRVS